MSRRTPGWIALVAGMLILGALGCAVQTETAEKVVEVTRVVTAGVEVESVVTKVVVEKPIEVEKVVKEMPPEGEREEITVRVWAADEFERQAINDAVDRFREMYPGITVHLTVVSPGGAR